MANHRFTNSNRANENEPAECKQKVVKRSNAPCTLLDQEIIAFELQAAVTIILLDMDICVSRIHVTGHFGVPVSQNKLRATIAAVCCTSHQLHTVFDKSTSQPNGS